MLRENLGFMRGVADGGVGEWDWSCTEYIVPATSGLEIDFVMGPEEGEEIMRRGMCATLPSPVLDDPTARFIDQ